MKKKRALWCRLREFNTPQVASKYRAACVQCRDAVADSERKYEEALVNRGNLGKFYRHAKAKFAGKKM